MKGLKLCVIGLIALVSGFALAVAVDAQATVTVAPAQLTVAGTREAVETRTLLLRTTEPITSVQIIPLDLTSADGKTVLSAGAIRADLPADQIAAGELLTIPVTIDLRGAPSGEFTGELLVDYHGGSLTVPVTATVKDPWPLPLIVLVVGVGLGMGVSAYRARGRPRDEVLVRVGQLRAQVRGDTELAPPTDSGQPDPAKTFRRRIEVHLVDVEMALQAEKWPDAQTAVGQAEAILSKWRKGREDWLTQLAYRTELTEQVEKLNANAPYVQVVCRGLEDAARDAPDLDEPDELRQRLDVLREQVNRYNQLRAQMDEVNQLGQPLPPDQAEQWRLKSLDLQQRLDALKPDDLTAYQTLQDEVGEALDGVKAAIAEQSRQAMRLRGPELVAKQPRSLPTTFFQLLAPAPSARALTAEEQVLSARARLRLFTWASYAVAVILLAGAGFAELYIARPTFGASTWGDYFALLAWGFGAEATRAAVTEMVRGWELPGLK